MLPLSEQSPTVAAERKAMPPGAVGDVNSNERGSGARYNAGKPPLELIPLRIIAESFAELADTDEKQQAVQALDALGHWQETGQRKFLILALQHLDLFHWRECAFVFDYGRQKYVEWNWAKGMAWSIPLACAARHLLAILDGEDVDPESGRRHVGHVMCNIVMLLTFMETYPEGDDRPRCLR